MANLELFSFVPPINETTEIKFLEELTFEVKVQFSSCIRTSQLQIQVWTDKGINEDTSANWYPIDLKHVGCSQDGTHLFKIKEAITSLKSFQFTFRHRFLSDHPDHWNWSHNWGVTGHVSVLPCSVHELQIQIPISCHIHGSLYIGNHAAALRAKEYGFKYLLIVDHLLDEAKISNNIIFQRIKIVHPNGHLKPDCGIANAVKWLKSIDAETSTVLVCSGLGEKMVATVAVAYSYFQNPGWSFANALKFVQDKKKVDVHQDLEHIIEKLYPRFFDMIDSYPHIPSWNEMFMLMAMTYKVTLKALQPVNVMPIKANEVQVQAWTNQVDRKHSEGTWHGIDLVYLGADEADPSLHKYGYSEIITSDRDFNFTFRLKLTGDNNWIWTNKYGEDGFIHVEPPRLYDTWTQGPDYDYIIGTFHIGNFIAATNAKECGFTHILNVADVQDLVFPEGNICYKKIPMQDGAHNSINIEDIWRAVAWLQQHDQSGNKLLVNCRAGIGRAGSVGVAFVFAREPTMSYEEAYEYVFARRFVYPHAGLKEILYTLYPRKE